MSEQVSTPVEVIGEWVALSRDTLENLYGAPGMSDQAFLYDRGIEYPMDDVDRARVAAKLLSVAFQENKYTDGEGGVIGAIMTEHGVARHITAFTGRVQWSRGMFDALISDATASANADLETMGSPYRLPAV